MEGPIPTMTRFELARFMAWQQQAPVRLAVLELPGQVPDSNFFENVASNRGVTVKVTTDLEIALESLGIEAANQADATDPQKNAPDG
jgi:hypothetical protein